MKYFDKDNNRLVFINKKATPDFWDKQWNIEDFKNIVASGKNNYFIKNITNKFLDKDKKNKILEGGCGKGQNVYGLDYWGYSSYGIDFANATVTRINNNFPKLNVRLGDVRKLPFEDNFFKGYWSLGVIEHFYDGCGDILDEATRVIDNGGYLFLTFPYMSPLRRMKAKLKKYPYWKGDNLKDFYQFALDENIVISDLEKRGFNLVLKKPFDGVKGLKDEIKIFKKILQYLYNSNNLILRVIKFGISFICSSFSSHSVLLVFKLKK